MNQTLVLGNFTGLAKDYSENRPDYSQAVLSAAFGILQKDPTRVSVADVGAGTGIWTRMISERGVPKIYAVEPNKDMRESASAGRNEIVWVDGTAENTGLDEASVDWVTMASSFHWANFDLAVKEFHRILKPDGWFTALWNPRLIETNPILVEIEDYIKRELPQLQRVSSGRSGLTSTLTERLIQSEWFEDVVYVESRHVIQMNPERYIGIWRSVNDIQVNLGVEGFRKFIEFVQEKTKNCLTIESTYLTRAWFAKKS